MQQTAEQILEGQPEAARLAVELGGARSDADRGAVIKVGSGSDGTSWLRLEDSAGLIHHVGVPTTGAGRDEAIAQYARDLKAGEVIEFEDDGKTYAIVQRPGETREQAIERFAQQEVIAGSGIDADGQLVSYSSSAVGRQSFLLEEGEDRYDAIARDVAEEKRRRGMKLDPNDLYALGEGPNPLDVDARVRAGVGAADGKAGSPPAEATPEQIAAQRLAADLQSARSDADRGAVVRVGDTSWLRLEDSDGAIHHIRVSGGLGRDEAIAQYAKDLTAGKAIQFTDDGKTYSIVQRPGETREQAIERFAQSPVIAGSGIDADGQLVSYSSSATGRGAFLLEEGQDRYDAIAADVARKQGLLTKDAVPLYEELALNHNRGESSAIKVGAEGDSQSSWIRVEDAQGRIHHVPALRPGMANENIINYLGNSKEFIEFKDDDGQTYVIPWNPGAESREQAIERFAQSPVIAGSGIDADGQLVSYTNSEVGRQAFLLEPGQDRYDAIAADVEREKTLQGLSPAERLAADRELEAGLADKAENERLQGLWADLTSGSATLSDLSESDRAVLSEPYGQWETENKRLQGVWADLTSGSATLSDLSESDRAVLSEPYGQWETENKRLQGLWTQVTAGEVEFADLPEADRAALSRPNTQWQDDNAKHQAFVDELNALPAPAIGQGSLAQSPEFIDLVNRMRDSGLYTKESLAGLEASAAGSAGLPALAETSGIGESVDLQATYSAAASGNPASSAMSYERFAELMEQLRTPRPAPERGGAALRP